MRFPRTAHPSAGWTAPELALRRAVFPRSAVLSSPFKVEEVVRMGRAPRVLAQRSPCCCSTNRPRQSTSDTGSWCCGCAGKGARRGRGGGMPHGPGLAAAYAHRVAILCAGRVAADGPSADVFTDRLLTDVHRQPVEVFPHPGPVPR